MARAITLLSDFGTADSYVGELKGVLVSLAPDAVLVDVTHDVRPGDVAEGRFLVMRAWHRFPPGTVHLAVVDPGVGTARRAVAGEARGHFFVGPDNGLFGDLVTEGRWIELAIPAGAAPTFHGRDVFAPAAARLAAGAALAGLGRPATGLVHAPAPAPRVDGVALVGAVVHVDRFGTLVTNIPGARVEPGVRIKVGGVEVGTVRRTYGDVAAGQLVAYVGSGGDVEIAVRGGSAARHLGVGVGADVRA